MTRSIGTTVRPGTLERPQGNPYRERQRAVRATATHRSLKLAVRNGLRPFRSTDVPHAFTWKSVSASRRPFSSFTSAFHVPGACAWRVKAQVRKRGESPMVRSTGACA